MMEDVEFEFVLFDDGNKYVAQFCSGKIRIVSRERNTHCCCDNESVSEVEDFSIGTADYVGHYMLRNQEYRSWSDKSLFESLCEICEDKLKLIHEATAQEMREVEDVSFERGTASTSINPKDPTTS